MLFSRSTGVRQQIVMTARVGGFVLDQTYPAVSIPCGDVTVFSIRADGDCIC